MLNALGAAILAALAATFVLLVMLTLAGCGNGYYHLSVTICSPALEVASNWATAPEGATVGQAHLPAVQRYVEARAVQPVCPTTQQELLKVQ